MKKLVSWVAGATTIGANLLMPIEALAYPAGDVFRVEQTNTSVRLGYLLRVSAASVAKHCEVKFYQDTDRTLKGSDYLGSKVAGHAGTTKSVKAITDTAGTFYIIARAVNCPAMSKESRVASAKFRVVAKRNG